MALAKYSGTAEAIAAARAAHLVSDGAPKVFEDPYAIELIGPRWRQIVSNPVLNFLFDRVLLRELRPVRALGLARSRHAEECFRAAFARGARQYVLVGAGFDSFALRKPELATLVRIFEVDHPATQEVKKARLARLGARPANVVYVSTDFESASLRDALLAAGLRAEAMSFFSWLGTTYYLSKEAVLRTLRSLASCAPSGSQLVFDYIDADGFRPIPSATGVRHCMKFAARLGEPWITGFDRAELATDLESCGLDLTETLSAADQLQRYFQARSDGLVPLLHSHLARVTLR
jgi:methyltransferase (TIGR00027 family)